MATVRKASPRPRALSIEAKELAAIEREHHVLVKQAGPQLRVERH